MTFHNRQEIKQYECLILIILLTIIPTGCSTSHTISYTNQLQSEYELIIDAFSWEMIPINCHEGDIVSGQFQVSSDGSLYPGDEQKYDDWTQEDIHFYIMNESNYFLFQEDQEFSAAYSRLDVSELQWSFRIPTEGRWYLIFYNDSIYMMKLTGSVSDSYDYIPILLMIGFLSILVILIGSTLYLKKWRQKAIA